MEESIFSLTLNEHMTGGMRKHDCIMANEELRNLEGYVKKHCPVKLRYSCNVMPMRNIDGFSFVEFLGGIMMTSSSAVINETAITELAKEAKPEWIKPFVQEMAEMPDKYPDFSTPPQWEDIKAAVILPGSNILQQLVCRWILEELPKRKEGVYLKPHPVTTNEILAMLANFAPLLPREISAYSLLKGEGIEIFTTMASTLAIQARLLGKEVHSIEESYFQYARPDNDKFYVAPFQHFRRLVMTTLGETPELWKLQAVLSNPLSGFFYPGYTTEADVVEYFKYMLKIKR